MNASWRKPVGMLLMLVGLAVYGIMIMLLAPLIGRLPWPLQTAVYVVLGFVWVFPVRPTLTWMELGVWRTPPSEGRHGASDGT